MDKKTAATNRKAYHDYQILEKYEAGIVLSGYEVKSLRQSKANLADGLVGFYYGEAYLDNVHISPYSQQSTHIIDYNPLRRRKLLLHKAEIIRLFGRVREKGLTLIPLEIYFNKKGIAKILIGLGKGKKTIDKRESIRRKDIERELERDMRRRNK